MVLAIVGGRNFNDWKLLQREVDEVCKKYDIDLIVSGEAKGADAFGKRYAFENYIEYQGFPADWDRYGKSAGYKRNVEIVDISDIVIAFWDGKSKGTSHTIQITRDNKKDLIIIQY